MFLLKLCLSVFCVIQLTFSYVNGQGEPCSTPDQLTGTCLVLPDCPRLDTLYKNNQRNRDVVSFLVQSQRNCGTRNINRSPIVCCQEDAPVTQPPTTKAPVPFFPTTTTPVGGNCRDPDGALGNCIDLRSCPKILNQVLARQSDPSIRDYIQRSNSLCNANGQNICCPLDNQPIQPKPNTVPGPGPQPRVPVNEAGVPKLLTQENGCGYSFVKHSKVVGGVPAEPAAWPWMALIGYTDNLGELSFKCGGSIITKRHVLTAAHCIRADLTTVRLGEHNLDTDAEAQHIDIAVIKVIRHPKYDKKDGHTDLAILVVDQDISFSRSIMPICIPTEEPVRTRNYEGYTPFIAGWGRTQEGGTSANILQELQIPVLPNTKCAERYKVQRRLISEKQFDDAVLCAGYLTGGKDSCQGDSGGPLMIPNRGPDGETYYFQIGIVSYGIGCARADVPGVYTRVQTFVDWIQEQVAVPI